MGVCDWPLMDKVCGAVDFATNPAGTVTDGIGAWIAKSAGELAASAANLAAKAVNETTAIDLNARWFRDNYELLLPIGLALTVGTFCIQLMFAAWRRDERALARAAIGTMTGVLFSFCAVAFTTVAITVVDALSDGLFKAANSSVDDAIRRVVKVNELGAMYGLGWGVPALVALGCAIGAFLYWGVMVARKVGVLIMVALAVFAGSGGGWEVAKRWRRGWIEATATLVVSKLLMTVVFLIGVSAMGKSDAHDGMAALSDAMAGIVVMVLVLLCPYATYKFVHWASDGGGHDDLHRTGVAGMAVAAGAAKTAGSLAMQASTGTPAPQGPSKVPGAGSDGVASGINPSGSLSKEGIDAGPPQPRTRFRYGEDANASGDKGRALIQRPGIPPLITRPSEGDTGGSEGGAPGGQFAGASAPGDSMTRAGAAPPADPAPGASPPPTTGPSATGSATPTSWVYPNQPPSGS
ncbi:MULTISPECIES: SCO6881 family protein [Streptomycetaceae]|uniref:ATP-binding protein n=1 Tax=Streptantibioticus cattleyicolor (strain ATCC 35852 / DSM 46488 / JCM 4925 / NBRC 14057 / NRRL 8057) TaxID=1003195 RepID=F8K4G8_STREN|nr:MULTISPECIES: ATP-binding protein [Streptomycetaceae]AEW95122.1 ATP-binding protein [Streptantibioticus cattleyicolor NRRL 8057 = DSM 46488]MYS59710.1 ATP-binding protein [Streptomyces sp. SID5468]CCB75469.1 putative ATP-binding protein [Streptantibioticus cattleyicolor NRRL 8057 = DSM 46488]